MKGCYIYGLSDPRSPEMVQYVGKANDLEFRVYKHVWVARHAKKGNTRLLSWLRALLDMGCAPVVSVLKITNPEEWQNDERAAIALWRSLNPNLLNIADGGNGPAFNSIETRKRMSQAHIGLRHSAETRRAISEGQRGNVRGPETREKIAAIMRGKPAHNRGIPRTPAEKLKIGAAIRAAWARKRTAL